MEPLDEYGPMAWLAAAMALACMPPKGMPCAFDILTSRDPDTMRVLHKETGAVWVFTARFERRPA
jgi:hypothetical protein